MEELVYMVSKIKIVCKLYSIQFSYIVSFVTEIFKDFIHKQITQYYVCKTFL